MHSIRIKIMAVTVSAILTSILALGGIGVLTIGVESDRSSAEKMRLISENMQRKLNAYLDSIKQSVDMAIHIARDSLEDEPDIKYLGSSGTPEQVARLDAALGRHCAEVEHAFESIASNTIGVVTYYYCINSDFGSNEHGFFLSRLDGDTFVRQPPLISSELDREDTEHTTWNYAPLKAARAVWIGPYKAHFLGERWTVSYVSPIFYQGFVVGVLGMDILFDTMIAQISDLQVYNTGFAFLMDRDGNLIYHPDVGIGDQSASLKGSIDDKLLRRRNSGDQLVRYTRNGETWQLAFAGLNDDHKVAVTAPVAEINASQRQLTLLLLLLAVALLAIFAIVTLLLMNALTKPLLRLTAASKKLAAGEYDVELDYDGNDEVGILTEAFRKMRDHLKLYISDLNSRAYTDAMTGVKNKGAFTASVTRLNDAIRLSAPDALPEFAIIIFDCDGLKHINDAYGHEHGDIYLQTACRIISRAFTYSPVFRMGGDEFSVILQNVDYEKRDILLNRFDHLLVAHADTAEHPWEKVRVSRGMAVFDPREDDSVQAVMNRADALMYEDKRRRKAGR